MKKQLNNEGFNIGKTKSSQSLKEANIVAIRPKKKHQYPDGGISNTKVGNVLNRQFNQPQANTHWVTDITYIRNHQCWSYLAAILDLGAKRNCRLGTVKDTRCTACHLGIEKCHQS
ncbi:MAG: hypothetical protein R3F25_12245 [Gammaproteobacteria bacterium]